MKKQSKVIISFIILAIMIMGIGYASLSNKYLSIDGQISATANQENFKVYYTGKVPKTYTSEDYITVEASPTVRGQDATVNMAGLTKKGDSAYVILEIENGSNDIDANVTLHADIKESEMFSISIYMCDIEGNENSDSLLVSGAKTYAKVFVELLKTPTSTVKATISATITASPVENSGEPEDPEPPISTDIFGAYYAKAEETLETLTLDEKVAQLFIIGTSRNTNYTELNKYNFGGHLYLLDSFYDTSGNVLKVDTVKNQIQTSKNASKIPLLMSIDEEGETVSRINKTIQPELGIEPFKNSCDLYTEGGLDAIRQDTISKANILHNLGFNLNFAPDIDIADEGFYIYKRTLKQNAQITGQFARTVITASKGTGVSFSPKHFPGYGNSTDTHSGFSTDNRSIEEFENKDLIPFREGIDAGAEIIMVSHNIVSCLDTEEPSSISKPVHDYLRNNMGYTGIIITDAINMDAIAKKYSTKDSVIKAINAGNDLICLVMNEGQTDITGGATLTYSGVIGYVKDAIANGTIKQETVDLAVKRILAWKAYKGLM